MTDIGDAIRRRRDSAGLSQLDLALAVGYKNGGDISRVETGKQWPDGMRLKAIADALKCSISELFAEAEGAIPMNASDRRAAYSVERTDWPPARPAPSLAGEPPTLDDALKDVNLMLTGAAQPELLAAIAYQGLMTRYQTERVCSAINSLVMAVESLRDEITAKK